MGQQVINLDLLMASFFCYNKLLGLLTLVARLLMWGLGTTLDVIGTLGDKYVEHNMPVGWILPNDGYGSPEYLYIIMQNNIVNNTNNEIMIVT